MMLPKTKHIVPYAKIKRYIVKFAFVVAIPLIVLIQALGHYSIRTAHPSDATNEKLSETTDKNIKRYINPPVGPAPVCTEEQRNMILERLQFQDDNEFKKGSKINFGKFQTSRLFACPDPFWIQYFYHEYVNVADRKEKDHDRFLGISVGCNKGYDAIRTARMGMSAAEFDIRTWDKEMKKPKDELKSGVCKQERLGQIKVMPSKNPGTMYCIEPITSTYSRMKKASEALGYDQKGLILTHAAIGSTQGTVKFPSTDAAGIETYGIHSCENQSYDCEEVPLYSLDNYVSVHVKDTGPIHILQIDTEGWDFDVLFGAGSVLDRTHYLEFEYHKVGKWGSLHLPDAVRLLDSKGFTCYWSGGLNLYRITECYFEVYNHWHGWSNVACVHRSQTKLLEIMENVFIDTLNDKSEE